MTSPTTTRWLLLIHQIPKSPAYLRAKVGKQLARVGAVAVKNSVYVLPRTNSTLEDFQWIARELHSAGAEATDSCPRRSAPCTSPSPYRSRETTRSR